MIQPVNYHKKMEEIITSLETSGRIGDTAPSLLLHSCCAPCSTAVIAALSSFFKITVFYFNPNIDEQSEYEKRAREQERLLSQMQTVHPVRFIEGEYCPEDFLAIAAPYTEEPEGGKRCTVCYTLRLEKTAITAAERKFDFFTTTLSISPMKDAKRINDIGSSLGERYGVAWLWSDFKKKEGYLKSIELSKKYGLYRQNYCGCSYSRLAATEGQDRRQ